MTQIINEGNIVIASCLHHEFKQENSLATDDGINPRVHSCVESALIALKFQELGLPESRRPCY